MEHILLPILTRDFVQIAHRPRSAAKPVRDKAPKLSMPAADRLNLPSTPTSEVTMKTDMRTRSKSITGVVVLVLLMTGAASNLYVFTESEPLKVFMFGTGLIGVAVWGKRYVRRRAETTTLTDPRSRNSGDCLPETILTEVDYLHFDEPRRIIDAK